MNSNVKITFKNIEPTDQIADFVNEKFGKLKRINGNIMRGQVTLSVPHRRHRMGNVFQAKVSVPVPGRKLIGQSHNKKVEKGDLYSAITDAFDAVAGQLKEHSQKRDAPRSHYTLAEAHALFN